MFNELKTTFTKQVDIQKTKMLEDIQTEESIFEMLSAPPATDTSIEIAETSDRTPIVQLITDLRQHRYMLQTSTAWEDGLYLEHTNTDKQTYLQDVVADIRLLETLAVWAPTQTSDDKFWQQRKILLNSSQWHDTPATILQDILHSILEAGFSNLAPVAIYYPVIAKLAGPSILAMVLAYDAATAVLPIIPGTPGLSRGITYTLLHGIKSGLKLPADTPQKKLHNIATNILIGVPVMADGLPIPGYVLIPTTNKARRRGVGILHPDIKQVIIQTRKLHQILKKYPFLHLTN